MESVKEYEWEIRPVVQSSNTTLFWHYVVLKPSELYQKADGKLRLAIESTIESLVNHEFTSGNHIEKMYGTEAKTIRINLADRLIFSIVDCHGLKIALIHSYILKHKLHENQFLFSQSTIKAGEKIFYTALSQRFKSLLNEAPALEPESLDTFRGLKHAVVMQNQHIVLDPLQSLSLEKNLPLLQSGPAGSGKTLMQIVRVLEHAKIYQEHISVVVITNTRLLANQINRVLESTGHLSSDVKAVDYQDWILDYKEERTLVDDGNFYQWFDSFSRLHFQLAKSQSNQAISSEKLTGFNKNISLLMSMMKYISGLSEAEYAERQALFFDAKKELYHIYNSYCAYLTSKKMLHPSFYKIPNHFYENPKYTLLAVDESQNFTLQQIENLIGQAKPISTEHRAVILNFDSHQAIDSHYSHRAKILKRLGIDESNHAVFESIYRSPPRIIELTNRLIQQIKYPLLGGLTDRYEAAVLKGADTSDLNGTEEGDWSWIQSTTESQQYGIESPNWLVVTHQDYLKEACQLFGNACTFSDVIGLEFSHVCLYKPFSHEEFILIDKDLAATTLTLEPSHEAKNPSKHRIHLPILNQIISAALRTTQHLVIFQNDHKIKNIYQRLQSFLKEKPEKVTVKNFQQSPILNQLEWFWVNGNDAYVKRCFENTKTGLLLGLSYDEFVAQMQTKLTDKMIPQASKTVQQDAVITKKALKPSFFESNQDKKKDAEKPSPKKTTINVKKESTLLHDSALEKMLMMSVQMMTASAPIEKNGEQYLQFKQYLDLLLTSTYFQSVSDIFYKKYQKSLFNLFLFNVQTSDAFNFYFEESPDKLEFLNVHYMNPETQDTLEHALILLGENNLLNQIIKHNFIQPQRHNKFQYSALSCALMCGVYDYLKSYESKFGPITEANFERERGVSLGGFDFFSQEVIDSFHHHTGSPEDWHPFNGHQNADFFKELRHKNSEKIRTMLTPDKSKVHLKLGETGLEPLHIAIQYQSFSLCALFLSLGSNPNAASVANDTPLSMAIKGRDYKVIRLLLYHGANPYFNPDMTKPNPIALAVRSRDDKIIIDFYRYGVISEETMDEINRVVIFNEDYLAYIKGVSVMRSLLSAHGISKEHPTNIPSIMMQLPTIYNHHFSIQIKNQSKDKQSFETYWDVLIENVDAFKHLLRQAYSKKKWTYCCAETLLNGVDNLLTYLVRKGYREHLKALITCIENPLFMRNEAQEDILDVAIETRQTDLIKRLLRYVQSTDSFLFRIYQAIIYDDFEDFSRCIQKGKKGAPMDLDFTSLHHRKIRHLIILIELFERPHFFTTEFKSYIPSFLKKEYFSEEESVLESHVSIKCGP